MDVLPLGTEGIRLSVASLPEPFVTFVLLLDLLQTFSDGKCRMFVLWPDVHIGRRAVKFAHLSLKEISLRFEADSDD